MTGRLHSPSGERESGMWLRGQLHFHRKPTIPHLSTIVGHSRSFVDFLVVTSHSHDRELFLAQPGEVREARRRFPNLLLLNGVEWEPPVGKHMTTFVTRGRNEAAVLRQLCERFDGNWPRARRDGLRAVSAALAYLRKQRVGGEKPIAVLNHPGVRPPFTLEQMRAWARYGDVCIGFGTGGHQAWSSPGGHVTRLASEVGAEWDTLLHEGRRWFLTAESDFHHHISKGSADCWPGEFDRQVVYCPERSYVGLMQGFRSGCMYLVQGRIIEALDFTVRADGRWAMMGEQLTVRPGTRPWVRLSVLASRPLSWVEVISDVSGRPEVVQRFAWNYLVADGPWRSAYLQLPVSSKGYYVRARGLARDLEEPYTGRRGPAWFYANPIWVLPRGKRSRGPQPRGLLTSRPDTALLVTFQEGSVAQVAQDPWPRGEGWSIGRDRSGRGFVDVRGQESGLFYRLPRRNWLRSGGLSLVVKRAPGARRRGPQRLGTIFHHTQAWLTFTLVDGRGIVTELASGGDVWRSELEFPAPLDPPAGGWTTVRVTWRWSGRGRPGFAARANGVIAQVGQAVRHEQPRKPALEGLPWRLFVAGSQHEGVEQADLLVAEVRVDRRVPQQAGGGR